MDLNRLPDDHGGAGAGGGGSGALESESVVFCSICLEPASKNVERTVVKLKCKHKFHLDCIGSAFNAKREMECPNCRKLEKGEWRFETGHVPSTDEDDDEMISQSYLSPLVTLQWCPYNDVAPIPVNFNEGNYFAGNYTHASVHQWNVPFVPAEGQVLAPAYGFQGMDAQYHGLPFPTATLGSHINGADQNPISSPAHSFPAPQSTYYRGVQPGAYTVMPSLQQQYYQLYNAPMPNHPARALSEQHGPVSVNGFHHISSRNLRPGFFIRPAATPQQNFTEAGFPTSIENLPSQGREIVQPANSFRNRGHQH